MLSQAIVEFGAPLQPVETPTPPPKGTEVLLKIAHCGVCHSDVHIHDGYFDLGNGKKLPFTSFPLPHTLGHEIEGEIVALGPEARGAEIGTRRAAFPWIGCGECPICRRGDEHLCNRARSLGCAPGIAGGYATHVLLPHPRYLVDYGNTPASIAGSYMCSGLTAFSAMKKVGALGPGEDILVIGTGGLGMMAIQFAKTLYGRGPMAADIDDARLAAARKAGASATYNTKAEGVTKQLLGDTKGGAAAIVDFVGSQASFEFASSAVRKSGCIIIVGLFGGAMSMPLPMFPLRALTIMGSFVGSLAETQEMMALVRAGKVDPIPVEERPLDQASRTLDDLRQGKITGRVVLTP